jgi:hypothetical protein
MHVCKKLLSYYKIKMSDISRLLDNIEDKIEQIGRVLASVPIRGPMRNPMHSPIHAPMNRSIHVPINNKEYKQFIIFDKTRNIFRMFDNELYTRITKYSLFNNIVGSNKSKNNEISYQIIINELNKSITNLTNYNIQTIMAIDKDSTEINFYSNSIVDVKPNYILYLITVDAPIRLHLSMKSYIQLESEYLYTQTNSDTRDLKKVYDIIGNQYNLICVRGDGNCYYRAVLYNLLISILYSDYGKEDKILYINIIKQRYLKNQKIQLFFDFLLQNIINYNFVKYIDLLTQYIEIDEEIVKLSRKLIIKYLDTLNKDVSELVNIGYTSYNNGKRQYINEQIKNGRCAEGPIVNSGIFEKYLGCSESYIVLIDSNQPIGYKCTIIYNDNRKYNHILPSSHILLKPGHFDALYKIRGRIIMNEFSYTEN